LKFNVTGLVSNECSTAVVDPLAKASPNASPTSPRAQQIIFFCSIYLFAILKRIQPVDVLPMTIQPVDVLPITVVAPKQLPHSKPCGIIHDTP
jgi:hypothetical protein